MKCPFCNAQQNELRVIETRHTPELVRRRRQCGVCEMRFSTMEVVVADNKHVSNLDVLLVPRARKRNK